MDRNQYPFSNITTEAQPITRTEWIDAAKGLLTLAVGVLVALLVCAL